MRSGAFIGRARRDCALPQAGNGGSDVTHALLALVAQIGVGLLTGRWLAGGIAAAGFFLGREHAQAEYRWIEEFGAGRRANLPAWGGLDPAAWTGKGVMDALLPVVAVGLCYAVATRLGGRPRA